VQLQEDVLVND